MYLDSEGLFRQWSRATERQTPGAGRRAFVVEVRDRLGALSLSLTTARSVRQREVQTVPKVEAHSYAYSAPLARNREEKAIATTRGRQVAGEDG